MLYYIVLTHLSRKQYDHHIMEKIIRALVDIRDIRFHLDDDSVDRVNRKYTSALLTMFAVLVSARQYMGEPIHCWCPEQCAENHEKYANMYCWVSDTYYIADDEPMPQENDIEVEPKKMIKVSGTYSLLG